MQKSRSVLCSAVAAYYQDDQDTGTTSTKPTTTNVFVGMRHTF